VYRQALNIILMLLLPFALLCRAQQTIQGDLTGTLGPGSYVVIGTCRVNTGDTLRIAPGTVLLHAGHYRWYINGQLIAVGIEEAPIIFSRRDPVPEHRWDGLWFYSGCEQATRLEWCQFDNCYSTNFPYDQGGVVYLGHVSIPISHCTFSDNYATWGGAIFADYSDSLVVEYCEFSHNNAGNGGAIYLNHCTDAVIRNCTVWGNEAEST
jgi:predicted outer membrane repeat protein